MSEPLLPNSCLAPVPVKLLTCFLFSGCEDKELCGDKAGRAGPGTDQQVTHYIRNLTVLTEESSNQILETYTFENLNKLKY